MLRLEGGAEGFRIWDLQLRAWALQTEIKGLVDKIPVRGFFGDDILPHAESDDFCLFCLAYFIRRMYSGYCPTL